MEALLEKINLQEISTRLVAFVPDLIAAILILILAWVFYRLTRGSLHAILGRAGFHEALIRLLVQSIYRIALIVFALVMAAAQIGINVGAALAGIGVAGIAIGFAAQDSLANTLAGFLIFWDKPFEVGDWVTVADKYGRVIDITMRSTRLRTNNNTYVIIPNKAIIDEVLTNHSKHGETRIDVPVGIAYKEDIPSAREVLLGAVGGLQEVANRPAPEVVCTALGASSVDLEVRVWIDNAGHEQPVYVKVMEASKLALDAAGIEIPYHHLQLFVEDVRQRVWDRAAALPSLAAAGGSPPESDQG